MGQAYINLSRRSGGFEIRPQRYQAFEHETALRVHFSVATRSSSEAAAFSLQIAQSVTPDTNDSTFRQILAFFASPHKYRISLGSGILHYTGMGARVPVTVDGISYEANFISSPSIRGGWHIDLFRNSEMLARESGSHFADNDLEALRAFSAFALPF